MEQPHSYFICVPCRKLQLRQGAGGATNRWACLWITVYFFEGGGDTIFGRDKPRGKGPSGGRKLVGVGQLRTSCLKKKGGLWVQNHTVPGKHPDETEVTDSEEAICFPCSKQKRNFCLPMSWSRANYCYFSGQSTRQLSSTTTKTTILQEWSICPWSSVVKSNPGHPLRTSKTTTPNQR